MQETQVPSPGWQDLLEEEMAACCVPAWRVPWTRGAQWAPVHGVTEGQTRLSDNTVLVTHFQRSLSSSSVLGTGLGDVRGLI